ncbi:nicotianamine synthase-like [Diospyros lotus]|uniref:nicotianamine synthase-like n=1 Tax=Diospyros lotus TaxID=55363 RepID=UPI00225C0F4C|nr:nicotianamine synthase-like [Diospyros lotus]
MVCQREEEKEELMLVEKVCEIYEKICSLESLKPSKDVNSLFTQLVFTCMPPSSIDVSKLPKSVQEMRSNLISLCGKAEALLETHFSTILASFDNPLHHLSIFPYFSNYIKLSLLEFSILAQHCYSGQLPARAAFVGSGPLPLTSIILATNHLTSTTFHNYDIDPLANSMAERLVSSDPDLSKRMFFHTRDIMDVACELQEYEVVFLAALVGMDKEEKKRVIAHLGKFMAPGATLMLRSAHGARGFLYPVVDPSDLLGFEVLSVFHPTDEVINSVVIARKLITIPLQLGLPCKCSDEKIQGFCPLNHRLNMIEELAVEEHHS